MNEILTIENNKFYDTPCRGYNHFKEIWLKNKLSEECLPSVREWWMMVAPEDFGFYPQSYTMVLYTEAELLEIFPESLPIIKKNIRILENELREIEPVLRELLKTLYKMISENWRPFTSVEHFSENRQKDFIYGLINRNFYDKQINKIKTRIKRSEKFVRMDEWKRKPPGNNTITDSDIIRAKRYPIENFIVEAPNAAGFVHCIFHNEKTPSCKIYSEDNRWHCYGCGEGGDVIDLVMKKEELEFIPAVKKILGK